MQYIKYRTKIKLNCLKNNGLCVRINATPPDQYFYIEDVQFHFNTCFNKII